MNWNERYAKEEEHKDHYKYIKKQGDSWVILQKGTGKVLSHHDSREKAIASFKAMMVNKHGSGPVNNISAIELAHQLGITLDELRNHVHTPLVSRQSFPSGMIKDDTMLSPEHADTLRGYARQQGIDRGVEDGVEGTINPHRANVLWDW